MDELMDGQTNISFQGRWADTGNGEAWRFFGLLHELSQCGVDESNVCLNVRQGEIKGNYVRSGGTKDEAEMNERKRKGKERKGAKMYKKKPS